MTEASQPKKYIKPPELLLPTRMIRVRDDSVVVDMLPLLTNDESLKHQLFTLNDASVLLQMYHRTSGHALNSLTTDQEHRCLILFSMTITR
jgi:hypothetical protein